MEQCPVCLEQTDRPLFSFQCGHPLCHGCSRRMAQANLNRCPTCRAPRDGMTEAQAAPSEDSIGDVRPYAGLFRWVSQASAASQRQPPPLPQQFVSPMAEDFAAALLLVQQEREARADRVQIDVSQLDDDLQDSIRALTELPTSIREWQRRRREQREELDRRRLMEQARQMHEEQHPEVFEEGWSAREF